MPVFVLTGIIILGYSIYIGFYIYPLLSDNDNPPDLYYWHDSNEKHNARIRGWVFFSVYSWCAFWLVVSYVRAMLTDPGQVPNTSSWEINHDEKESEDSALITENRKDGKVRLCNHCNLKKPDRCHHCRQCARCTLKMDHHCN